MYQLFPSYGSFVLFAVALTIIGILSVVFRPQLNAIEDAIRDNLEAKLREKKAPKHAAKKQASKQVPQRKMTTVTVTKNGNMAA